MHISLWTLWILARLQSRGYMKFLIRARLPFYFLTPEHRVAGL